MVFFNISLLMMEVVTYENVLLVFSIDCVTKYVLFLKLTLDWPSYVKEWHAIESNMKKYELCSHLRKSLNCITLVMICIATGTIFYFIL